MRNRTYFCPPIPQKAWVAELVDALDSKSSSLGSAGSIPAPGTKSLVRKNGAFCYCLMKETGVPESSVKTLSVTLYSLTNTPAVCVT